MAKPSYLEEIYIQKKIIQKAAKWGWKWRRKANLVLKKIFIKNVLQRPRENSISETIVIGNCSLLLPPTIISFTFHHHFFSLCIIKITATMPRTHSKITLNILKATFLKRKNKYPHVLKQNEVTSQESKCPYKRKWLAAWLLRGILRRNQIKKRI